MSKQKGAVIGSSVALLWRLRAATASLEQTAREVGLEATSSSVDVMSERDRQLTQFSIQMELAGNYGAVREFIHRLERAPKFVVIDRVTLQENPAEGGLALKLELSTFYRGRAQ